MTTRQLSQELEEMLADGFSLPRVVSTLRDCRRRGITRHEARLALEAMRDHAPDEATEDRILEIMDVVSGFCALENTVWEDKEPAPDTSGRSGSDPEGSGVRLI